MEIQIVSLQLNFSSFFESIPAASRRLFSSVGDPKRTLVRVGFCQYNPNLPTKSSALYLSPKKTPPVGTDRNRWGDTENELV